MARQATWKLVPSIPLVVRRIKMADDRSEKEVIEGYFHQGYQNDVILEFLSVYHNITISLSSLRADVSKYRTEAYKTQKLKNPKKIHRVALVELLSEIYFLFRFDDYY